MRNGFKVLGLLALLLVGLAIVPAVLAEEEELEFVFDKVELNGDEVEDLENPDTVAVERGDTLDLHVVLHLENASEDVDVRLEAWMGGYEYHSIRAESEEFTLRKSGSSKTKDLTLELPNDMDAGDYTLYVKVLDHNVMLEIPLILEVEKTRHKLSIQDVLVNPTNPEAGETVFVSVRLENTGDRKEEDITVEVSALGVSYATWIDELGTEELENDDDETSESTRAMPLRLPEDVAVGDYDLTVKVTYNRGHSTLEEVFPLHVVGAEEVTEEPEVRAIVSVDTTTQSVAQGSETLYKLTFANLGEEAQLFSASVAGAQLWADARVDPAFVSVAPGETGEVYVYLKAHDDAEEGNHLFNLQLRAGSDLVKELPLGARVTEGDNKMTGASVSDGLLSSSTLKLGFVGLIVLVVIVGLVVALRKLKDDDEYPLEPKDGQTYY